MDVVQYAALSDIHFPYEGKCYYKAIEQIKTWPNLKRIYLNGDIGEFESISTHPKGPTANNSLLAEIEILNQKLDTIQRLFPEVFVDLIEGNHCSRLFRYIRDIAPQMWGMIQMPSLLKFDQRPNWKFHTYGPTQWVKCGKTHDLWLRHEPLASGPAHARATAEKSYVSVMYGHVHSISQYTCKKIGPKPYHVTAYSPGWLGDIKKTCFDYRGSKDNWASGFARIDVDEKSGEYEVRIIRL